MDCVKVVNLSSGLGQLTGSSISLKNLGKRFSARWSYFHTTAEMVRTKAQRQPNPEKNPPIIRSCNPATEMTVVRSSKQEGSSQLKKRKEKKEKKKFKHYVKHQITHLSHCDTVREGGLVELQQCNQCRFSEALFSVLLWLSVKFMSK